MKAAWSLLALLAATPAFAATCKENPARTGPCDILRGAIMEGAGGVMLQTSRKQSLNAVGLVVDGDMPPRLAEVWEQGSHVRVQGSFEACPLPQNHVCIESADDLSILNPPVPGRGRRR